jgi:hypothetical protein
LAPACARSLPGRWRSKPLFVRSITVCAGEAVVTADSRATSVATMLATMLIVDGER